MTSSDVLDQLVANPQESLTVELKPWLDPANPEHKAKIAKACLALRNQDGGHLLLGFEDDCTVAANAPADVQATYHVDLIQEIVSKYASEAFSVQVEFRARHTGSQLHPIVVVPSGVRVPVMAKSTSFDAVGSRLIEDDSIYVRSLTSNNRVSSSKLRRQDIRELMERCFSNREADIGAFIRNHLPGINRPFLENLLSLNATPISNSTNRALEYLNHSLQRYQLAFAERQQTPPSLGTMEAAACFDVNTPNVSLQDLLWRMRTSVRDYSGWPPWSVIYNDRVAELRPYVVDDCWEALMHTPEDHGIGAMIDFWRADPKGLLYYLRVLEDDLSSRVEPGAMIDFYIAIYRVIEVLGAVLELANTMGVKPEENITVAFRWTGLKGRVLGSRDPQRRLRSELRSVQDQVIAQCSLPATTQAISLPPFVDQVIKPLFRVFEGFEFEAGVVESITSKVLSRQS